MNKKIGDMTPQELIKMLIPAIGEMIKTEARTTSTLIQANTDASLKSAKEEIETKLTNRINNVEKNLGEKIDKITEKVNNQEIQISRLQNYN